MTEQKRHALQRLDLLTGFRYPLRWADEVTSLGDYDGRDLTIQVFNIPSERQREFHRSLREFRSELRREFGKPITFVFHTPEATRQYYAHLFSTTSGVVVDGEVYVELLPGGVGTYTVVETSLNFQLPKAA